METLLSVAPFLEGLQYAHGGTVIDSLAKQLRKGLPLRLHPHQLSHVLKAIFLGEDNRLYMAEVEGGSKSKVTEIMHGQKPWELVAERKSDLNEVQLSGTREEALVLSHFLELFSVPSVSGVMTRVLRDFKVLQVACSSDHCLALATNGQVFSKGRNDWGQLGLGNTAPSNGWQQVPLPMETGSARFATFVACGSHHSIVICEQESVHAFGQNQCLQLGCSDGNIRSRPLLISCPEQIKKVCCGLNHTLLLDSSGKVFGCGSGQNCQLGRNLRSNHTVTAITLPPAVKARVVDIISNPHLDVSVLLDEEGILYICGAAGELFGHSNPIEDFFPLKQSFVVVNSQIVCMQPDTTSYKACFNESTCCDIEVRTRDVSEPIYFGWDTIRARSPYLTKLVDSELRDVQKLQDGKRKVTIEKYAWKTQFAYGKYLHENVLDAEPQTLLELLQLADEYQDETGLASLCASMLIRKVTAANLADCLEHCINIKFPALAPGLVKQGLTLSNVCDVLNVIARAEDAVAAANPRDELSESLIANIKAIGMAFAAQHGTAVIEGAQFSELLPRIAKEFLLKLAKLKLLKT